MQVRFFHLFFCSPVTLASLDLKDTLGIVKLNLTTHLCIEKIFAERIFLTVLIAMGLINMQLILNIKTSFAVLIMNQ